MLNELKDSNAVKQAIAEFDKIGRENFLKKYGFQPSREYLLQQDGKLYDSKAIVGAAFGYAFPRRGPLTSNQFKGGEASVRRKLEKLGFRIVRVFQSNEHYLLKLNREEVPSSESPDDWETKEFSIEPVRAMRGGQRIAPAPPPVAPGSVVAIWVNDGDDLGGIIATAIVAQVGSEGAHCRLRNIVFHKRLGLAELTSGSGVIQDIYQDIDSNRRSKVRHLSASQWTELEKIFHRRSKQSESNTPVAKIAKVLNERATDFRIGGLQRIRSQIHQRRVIGRDLFSSKSVKDTYAFHSGGRAELQFNIGEEMVGENERFRWGVAFSFESSRSFPDSRVLAHHVRFFNDYIAMYADDFSDMTMWRYVDNEGPIDMGCPRTIDSSLVRNKVFVFLGKHASLDALDPATILKDFDRLLPLYEYVESKAAVMPMIHEGVQFNFKPGHRIKARWAVATVVAQELEMDLRHEAIQAALHDRLAKEHGVDEVGTEQHCPYGMRVDAIVRHHTGYWLYEIKTSSSPRVCLREAVGQLLEYCLWPGGVPAEKLIVVGETPLDSDGKAYLAALNGKLSIPVEYLTVKATEAK